MTVRMIFVDPATTIKFKFSGILFWPISIRWDKDYICSGQTRGWERTGSLTRRSPHPSRACRTTACNFRGHRASSPALLS